MAEDSSDVWARFGIGACAIALLALHFIGTRSDSGDVGFVIALALLCGFAILRD